MIKEGVQKLGILALGRKLASFGKVPFLKFSDNFQNTRGDCRQVELCGCFATLPFESHNTDFAACLVRPNAFRISQSLEMLDTTKS